MALPISSIVSRKKTQITPYLQGNTAFNTNVRGLKQPSDVTTEYVTMDTYSVAQCAQSLRRYAKQA